MLSVIVPVYNTEKYLTQCIESILTQTLTEFELLLIDDGSSDRSGEICDRYALQDNRIRVFHQDNQGASVARNTGIDHATKDWLCFIDSDDYIGKDYLSAFLQQGNLTADCLNIQGRHLVSDIDGSIIQSTLFPNLLATEKNMEEVFSKYNFLSNSGPVDKLFNRHLLNSMHLRFRPDLTVREDAMFVYTYRSRMKSVKLINNTAYYYRQAFKRSSLCSRNHPYQVFMTIKNELPPIIHQVLEQWGLLENRTAQNTLSYYKDRTCISIIKSIYAYDIPRKERIKAWHAIFDDDAYFNDPYFHISKFLLLFRIATHCLPIPLVDACCSIPFHFYYRQIKKTNNGKPTPKG